MLSKNTKFMVTDWKYLRKCHLFTDVFCVSVSVAGSLCCLIRCCVGLRGKPALQLGQVTWVFFIVTDSNPNNFQSLHHINHSLKRSFSKSRKRTWKAQNGRPCYWKCTLHGVPLCRYSCRLTWCFSNTCSDHCHTTSKGCTQTIVVCRVLLGNTYLFLSCCSCLFSFSSETSKNEKERSVF